MHSFFSGSGYSGGTAKLEVDVCKIGGSTTGVSTLGLGASSVIKIVVNGTATTTSITSDTGGLSSVDDNYNCRLLIAISGALVGQVQEITDYNGITKKFTTTPWTSIPADDDEFIIV